MAFKFKLKDKVKIIVSGEAGEVVGRAEYTNGSKDYHVRYRAADGRAVECWCHQSAIELDL